MELIRCPICKETRGFKRTMGVGTLFAVVCTAGLWLLILPLYEKRCIVCGYPWTYATGKREDPNL